MIDEFVFSFLKNLKVNNNRDWFADHKADYQKAKVLFDDAIRALIDQVYEIDPSIGSLEPKQCVFRIFRDVRFSKDKVPYKTHMGAYVVPGGRKNPMAGYYIHVEPGASFFAGGIYRPPSDVLLKVRKEIYHFADEFKACINAKDFSSHFPLLFEDKLKLGPKGFPKDFEDIDLLKYKSFIVSKNMTDEALIDKGVVVQIGSMIKSLEPFNKFINRGITYEEEDVAID